MSNLRIAAEQALKSLGDAITVWTEEMEFRSCVDVADSWIESAAALREALAHPDPEPVAWMVYTLDGKSAFVTDNPKDFTQDHRALPLYTSPSTPPPQHQADPVVWQFRMRPDWVRDKDFWEPWTNCTKEQAADYQRVPHLHDWTYESRSLFTHPPQRKPLTEEEIRQIALDTPIGGTNFARAIERAHGIGGSDD